MGRRSNQPYYPTNSDDDIPPEQAGILMGHYASEVYESDGEVAIQEMPNLHQLLEDIKGTDNHIESLRKKRQEMVAQYHNEKDKLDAHYSMVVDRPVDPGPTVDRARF